MLALFAVLLGLTRPPAAYLQVGSSHIPLAISSWCWGTRCGAPISASAKTATVVRGTTVRAELAFAPSRIRLAVGGASVPVARHGSELSWRAAHGGGVSLRVTWPHGWVTYVGRIAIR